MQEHIRFAQCKRNLIGLPAEALAQAGLNSELIINNSLLSIRNSEFITHNLEIVIYPPQKPHRIRATGRQIFSPQRHKEELLMYFWCLRVLVVKIHSPVLRHSTATERRMAFQLFLTSRKEVL